MDQVPAHHFVYPQSVTFGRTLQDEYSKREKATTPFSKFEIPRSMLRIRVVFLDFRRACIGRVLECFIALDKIFHKMPNSTEAFYKLRGGKSRANCPQRHMESSESRKIVKSPLGENSAAPQSHHLTSPSIRITPDHIRKVRNLFNAT